MRPHAGIGRATAKLFAGKGYFVGLLDVQADGLRSVASELGVGRCVSVSLDVTNADAVKKAIESVVAAGDTEQLDALVLCAGICREALFDEVALPVHAATIDVNFKGAVHCIYSALPALQRAGTSHIVSIASTTAHYGLPEYPVYGATKAAIRALTEALNLEFERFGIQVRHNVGFTASLLF